MISPRVATYPFLLSGALIVSLSASCGDGAAKMCAAGQQLACACPSGAMGAQRCRDDGSGYAECLGCDTADLSMGPDLSANPNEDMSPVHDLAGADLTQIDLAVPTYTTATPHDVDTNTIGGLFGKGTGVQMTGLIVLTPPVAFASNSKADCTYEVFAQDPSCSTPPCGIVVETVGVPNPNGTGKFCPFASDTNTLLKNVWSGDKINIKGIVGTFSSTASPPATGTVVEHEIILDTLSQTATKQALPNSLDVVDTNPSLFVPFSGAGWAMYEGTYIKLKPASGKFTTTLDSFGGWICAPGGAQYTDTFTSFFKPDGGVTNMYPPTGSMFSAIAGVVGMGFGGGILPFDQSAFTP